MAPVLNIGAPSSAEAGEAEAVDSSGTPFAFGAPSMLIDGLAEVTNVARATGAVGWLSLCVCVTTVGFPVAVTPPQVWGSFGSTVVPSRSFCGTYAAVGLQ